MPAISQRTLQKSIEGNSLGAMLAPNHDMTSSLAMGGASPAGYQKVASGGPNKRKHSQPHHGI